MTGLICWIIVFALCGFVIGNAVYMLRFDENRKKPWLIVYVAVIVFCSVAIILLYWLLSMLMQMGD